MTTRYVLYNYTRKQIHKVPVRLNLVTKEALTAYAEQLFTLTDEIVKVHEVYSAPVETRVMRTPLGYTQNEYAAA